MTFEELTDAAKAIIQDSSFDKEIAGLTNEAVLSIAHGMKIPGQERLTAPLPVLFAQDYVSLVEGQRQVDLPPDYHRGLFAAYDTSRCEPLRVLDSFKTFMRKYPPATEMSGPPACVAFGSKLFYHSPQDRSVLLSYYSKPNALSNPEDTPASVPAHLQRRLIVNYVCKDIFSRIEDGMEGRKVNTAYHDEQLQQAVIDLDKALGTDGDPLHIEDESDYIP